MTNKKIFMTLTSKAYTINLFTVVPNYGGIVRWCVPVSVTFTIVQYKLDYKLNSFSYINYASKKF